MLKPLVTLAALAALIGPAVALDGPEEAVKAIYFTAGVPDTAREADRWLARDVAKAYKVALAADEPKPSTDFDWRYGTQDYDVTEVNVQRAGPMTGKPTMTDVAVSFRNFNQPTETITWTMCLGRKGWRVADVRGMDDSGGWRLRQMLDLPLDQVTC